MNYIFAGDSWALKGFTEQNHNKGNTEPLPGDVRLADHWSWHHELALAPGKGNTAVLRQIIKLQSTAPVIWVWTEPGRDFGFYNPTQDPHDWMRTEDLWRLRKDLTRATLTTIKNTITNPIAFIGGLSDIDPELAREFGYTVLCPSWQLWIASTLGSKHFTQGWGASDIGWRAHHNGVTPSKAATFAWDEQIKEWCWWEERGYFSHEHPSPRANQEFAEHLQPSVEQWLKQYEK
jgi:hypothetical protein